MNELDSKIFNGYKNFFLNIWIRRFWGFVIFIGGLQQFISLYDDVQKLPDADYTTSYCIAGALIFVGLLLFTWQPKPKSPQHGANDRPIPDLR